MIFWHATVSTSERIARPKKRACSGSVWLVEPSRRLPACRASSSERAEPIFQSYFVLSIFFFSLLTSSVLVQSTLPHFCSELSVKLVISKACHGELILRIQNYDRISVDQHLVFVLCRSVWWISFVLHKQRTQSLSPTGRSPRYLSQLRYQLGRFDF